MGKFRYYLYKFLVHIGMIEPELPLLVDKEQVNLVGLIEVQPLLDFLMMAYDDFAEEEEWACEHFLEGMGEAIGIVQFVYEEQLDLNKTIVEMHSDLEAFIKGELDL